MGSDGASLAERPGACAPSAPLSSDGASLAERPGACAPSAPTKIRPRTVGDLPPGASRKDGSGLRIGPLGID